MPEYYIYDPDRNRLRGWLRGEDGLDVIPQMADWVSPRLNVRFAWSQESLELYRPDGNRFLTYMEIAQGLEQERHEKEQERQRAEQERQARRDAPLVDSVEITTCPTEGQDTCDGLDKGNTIMTRKTTRRNFLLTSVAVAGGVVGCGAMKTNLTSKSLDQPSLKTSMSEQKSSNTGIPATILGMNLGEVASYSTQLPFLNRLKLGGVWTPHSDNEWDTHEALDLDASGYPKSIGGAGKKYTRVLTQIMNGMKGYYPTGRYVLLWEGEGKINATWAAKKVDESVPGRFIYDVTDTDDGVLIEISATNASNPIRNVRFVEEKYETALKNGEVFHPDFLAMLTEFQNIRFMDWMKTNGSPQKEWADRPKLDDAFWGNEKGIPIEVMVSLCNKLNTNGWFCMPALATDDYITQFAKYVLANLNKTLKARVEYSNEVWNWSFPQATQINNLGKARFPKGGDHPIYNYYGMRTAQIATIWKNVFGAQKDRFIAVISTQTAWKGLEGDILSAPLWTAESSNNPKPSDVCDEYAITAYFSGGLAESKDKATVEGWASQGEQGLKKGIQQLKDGSLIADSGDHVKSNLEFLKYHLKVATDRKLKLVVYEGGLSLAGGDNETLTNFFIALSRHPDMYEVYQQLLSGWESEFGGLFNHYSDCSKPSKWGCWGAREYVTQTDSPRSKALRDFLAGQKATK